MTGFLDLNEAQILAVLRGFLLDILPPGVEVIRAQVNRVPTPTGPDYVVMTPILRERLSTNVVSVREGVITASIAANVMMVTALRGMVLQPGLALSGEGLAPFTRITGVISGTPGAEQYAISPSQTVASGDIYAGGRAARMGTQITTQIDIHGPAAANNAQIIATLLRDEYACQFMAASSFPIQPLYASEPREMPFVNGEQQYEWRWVIDAVLQANQTVTSQQQFAGELAVGLISVDAVYPP